MDEKKNPEVVNPEYPTEVGAVGIENNNVNLETQIEQPAMSNPTVDPTQPNLGGNVPPQEPVQPAVQNPIPGSVQPTMSNPTVDPTQPNLGENVPPQEPVQPAVQNPIPNSVQPTMSNPTVDPMQPNLGGNVPPKEPSVSQPNPGNKKNNIPFVVLGVILILVIGFLGFNMLKSNPKNIIINSIKNGKQQLENKIDVSSKFDLGKNYTVKGTMKFNVASDLFKQGLNATNPETQVYAKLIENLNKVDVQYDYAQDLTNKKLAFDMTANLNQEQLFQMIYYNDNDKQYVFLGKLLDKWLAMEDYNVFETLDNEAAQEDLDYVYNVVLKSLNKNLDKEYFKIENTTIQLNGKDEKVTQVMLVLDNNKANTLMEKIMTDIQTDKKANDILVKNLPEFKDYKFEESMILSDDQIITYSVYTKGLTKEVVKYQLEDKISKYDSTGVMYTKNTTPILEVYQDGTTQMKFEMKEDKDSVNIIVKDGKDTQLGVIKLTDKEDQVTVDADFTVDGMKLVLKMDTTMKEVSKNKEYKGTTNASLSITQGNANIVSLTIDGTSNATKGADIKQNPTGAVNQNLLTITDQQKLQENLTNLLLKLMS